VRSITAANIAVHQFRVCDVSDIRGVPSSSSGAATAEVSRQPVASEAVA
jgi:hypothetical protein